MSWFASPQERRADPRTTRLCVALSINRREACGLLDFLDWWALDYARSGDLNPFTDEELAYACDWEGDPAAFVAALVQSGHITEDRRIADWWELAEKWLKRREEKAQYERGRRSALPRGHHVDATLRTDESHVDTTWTPRGSQEVPGLTGPDVPDVPDLPIPPSVPPEGDAAAAAPTATDPPAAGGKRSRGKSLATPAPADFELTDALVAFGEGIGLDRSRLDFETGKFLDHHRARGSTFRDWIAAWRTWMRRAVEYGDTGPAPDIGDSGPSPSPARPRPPGPSPLVPEVEAEPAAVEVWDAALTELRLGMSQANFESYLAGSVGVRLEGDLLTVAVPNPLVREVLEQRFRQHILRALLDVLGSPCRVGFVGARAALPPSPDRSLRMVAGGRS